MAYTEQTGTKANNDPIYCIQDLSRPQMKMIKAGLDLLKLSLVAAEDTERHRMIPEVEILINQLKT